MKIILTLIDKAAIIFLYIVGIIVCIVIAVVVSTYLNISFLTSIIIVILLVLNIILFFKIWGMTNSIKEITSHLINRENKINRIREDKDNSIRENKKNNIRKAYLRGDLYVAQDLLTDMLLNELLSYQEEGKYQCVDSIIAKYEPIYRTIGIDIPESILRLREDPTDTLSQYLQ